VHTISIGTAHPEDLDLYLKVVEKLPEAAQAPHLPPGTSGAGHGEPLVLPPLGSRAFPTGPAPLGRLILPALLWLHDLWRSWDLEAYVRA